MGARSTRPARETVEFGSLLAGATAAQRSTRLCLAGDVLGEIDALNAELWQAKLDDDRLNRAPLAPGIAAEIVELTELAHASEVEFVFKAIGRKAWRDLVAAHPPLPNHTKAGADFNTETMPIEAMAASCIEPKGATVEGFRELAESDKVTDAQWNKLWFACHAANAGSADVPFSVAAYAIARPTETNSGQPEPTESLAASS